VKIISARPFATSGKTQWRGAPWQDADMGVFSLGDFSRYRAIRDWGDLRGNHPSKQAQMSMVARDQFSVMKIILFFGLPAKLIRFFAKLTWSGVPGGGIRGREGAGLDHLFSRISGGGVLRQWGIAEGL
jgi:hypothetical protein